MDTANTTGLTQLEAADRRVAEAEERCAQQRVLIKSMAAAGQDTADVESVLERFESTLDLLRQHQQLLRRSHQNRP